MASSQKDLKNCSRFLQMNLNMLGDLFPPKILAELLDSQHRMRRLSSVDDQETTAAATAFVLAATPDISDLLSLVDFIVNVVDKAAYQAVRIPELAVDTRQVMYSYPSRIPRMFHFLHADVNIPLRRVATPMDTSSPSYDYSDVWYLLDVRGHLEKIANYLPAKSANDDLIRAIQDFVKSFLTDIVPSNGVALVPAAFWTHYIGGGPINCADDEPAFIRSRYDHVILRWVAGFSGDLYVNKDNAQLGYDSRGDSVKWYRPETTTNSYMTPLKLTRTPLNLEGSHTFLSLTVSPELLANNINALSNPLSPVMSSFVAQASVAGSSLGLLLTFLNERNYHKLSTQRWDTVMRAIVAYIEANPDMPLRELMESIVDEFSPRDKSASIFTSFPLIQSQNIQFQPGKDTWYTQFSMHTKFCQQGIFCNEYSIFIGQPTCGHTIVPEQLVSIYRTDDARTGQQLGANLLYLTPEATFALGSTLHGYLLYTDQAIGSGGLVYRQPTLAEDGRPLLVESPTSTLFAYETLQLTMALVVVGSIRRGPELRSSMRIQARGVNRQSRADLKTPRARLFPWSRIKRWGK